jgi:hypothetical protein
MCEGRERELKRDEMERERGILQASQLHGHLKG